MKVHLYRVWAITKLIFILANLEDLKLDHEEVKYRPDVRVLIALATDAKELTKDLKDENRKTIEGPVQQFDAVQFPFEIIAPFMYLLNIEMLELADGDLLDIMDKIKFETQNIFDLAKAGHPVFKKVVLDGLCLSRIDKDNAAACILEVYRTQSFNVCVSLRLGCDCDNIIGTLLSANSAEALERLDEARRVVSADNSPRDVNNEIKVLLIVCGEEDWNLAFEE